MAWVVAAMTLMMSGIILIAIRLFEDGHFYSAALLLVSVGAGGLLVSLGMYMKKENES